MFFLFYWRGHRGWGRGIGRGRGTDMGMDRGRDRGKNIIHVRYAWLVERAFFPCFFCARKKGGTLSTIQYAMYGAQPIR